VERKCLMFIWRDQTSSVLSLAEGRRRGLGERATKGGSRQAGERLTGNGYITFDYDPDPFTPLFVYVTNLFKNTLLNDT